MCRSKSATDEVLTWGHDCPCQNMPLNPTFAFTTPRICEPCFRDHASWLIEGKHVFGDQIRFAMMLYLRTRGARNLQLMRCSCTICWCTWSSVRCKTWFTIFLLVDINQIQKLTNTLQKNWYLASHSLVVFDSCTCTRRGVMMTWRFPFFPKVISCVCIFAYGNPISILRAICLVTFGCVWRKRTHIGAGKCGRCTLACFCMTFFVVSM